jgi:hypothetical protein
MDADKVSLRQFVERVHGPELLRMTVLRTRKIKGPGAQARTEVASNVYPSCAEPGIDGPLSTERHK